MNYKLAVYIVVVVSVAYCVIDLERLQMDQ